MQNLKNSLWALFLSLVGWLFSPLTLPAQTLDTWVIAPMGAHLTGGGQTLDCTLGEPVAQTFVNDETLQQGFHQVWLVATPVVDPADAPSEVAVFPNPTAGLLNIRAEAELDAQIFDASGRSLIRADCPAGGAQMDLSGLPAGLYVLRLLDNQGAPVRAFRIQKLQ